MNPNHVWPRRYRMLALSTLAMLGVAAAIFATPWGRAFAQSIFKFFAVAPAASFPLPTEQLALYGIEPTVPPTFAAQLEPVSTAIPSKATYPSEPEEAAAPTSAPFVQTPVAGCEEALASLSYRCQVSRAEAAVGFDLKEPPGDLQGLVFSSAGANPTLRFATLIYTAIGGGSQLTISQVRGDMSASSWGEVPPSAAIEEVKVGEYDGEYVRGVFAVEPGATSATWWADGPVRRLRWREGNVLFEIRLDGHVAPVEYLEKDTLIELAESLTYAPNTAEGQLRAEYLTSVKDAEILAGFDIKEPTILPEGFAFRYAEYDAASQRVRLVYEAGTGAGIGGLVIFETPITAAPEINLEEIYPPGAVEMVQIGNTNGQYAYGSFWTPYVEPGTPTPTPAWNPDDPHKSLTWQTDSLLIQMSFFTSQWYGGRLEKADMIAIAESMK